MVRILFSFDAIVGQKYASLFASTNVVFLGSGRGDSWSGICLTFLFLYNVLWLDSTILILV